MKLLLDEHLPKAVAVTLCRLHAGTDAQQIADWQNGRWLGEGDPVLLEGLWEDRRILASYDRATLPGHLAERIAEGKDHAGVIFVDQERFPASRIAKWHGHWQSCLPLSSGIRLDQPDRDPYNLT